MDQNIASAIDTQAKITGLETNQRALEARVVALELFQRKSEIEEARRGEQWKYMDSRFNDLDRKIENVSGVLTKLMWLIVSGMVTGVVVFMLGGGFRLG